MSQDQANHEQPCHLLNLPPEIRNRINQFALTSGFGCLQLWMPGHGEDLDRALLMEADETDQNKQFNQLKFVSKQVYQDTAGMEVRHNNIVISKKWSYESSVGTQLLAFINQIPVSKRYWLIGCTFRLKDLWDMTARTLLRSIPAKDPISNIVRSQANLPYVSASYVPYINGKQGGLDGGVGELIFDGVVFAHFTANGRLRVILPAIKLHAIFVYR